MSNPYDGIATTYSNVWTGKTEPLTADWLKKGFDALLARDREDREREAATAREFREAMKDPAWRKRWEAQCQACRELNVMQPDPLNPPIISRQQYEVVEKRVAEILGA